jgi:hypothetical protein
MSQTCESPKTFLATEALVAFRRVKITASSGTHVEYADQSDSSDFVGVTEHDVAIGGRVAVRLRSHSGTFKIVAADTFSLHATLYAADDGKVSDTSSGKSVYQALEACTTAGDIVECLPTGVPIVATARADLSQDNLASYPVPVGMLRVWDAPSTVAVAATAANDDLAVVYNTFLTAKPTVETGDIKTTSSTRKVGFQFTVPPEYVAGETATLRINAGMKTTVAGTSCTVDAQVTRQAGPTVDICATAATTINSLTPANVDFTLTPTDLVPGDVLDVVLSVAYVDAATGTAVIGKINSVELFLDIKG